MLHILNTEGFFNCIIGSKVLAIFPDWANALFQSRHKFLSWQNSLPIMEVELHRVGLLPKGASPSRYVDGTVEIRVACPSQSLID